MHLSWRPEFPDRIRFFRASKLSYSVKIKCTQPAKKDTKHNKYLIARSDSNKLPISDCYGKKIACETLCFLHG